MKKYLKKFLLTAVALIALLASSVSPAVAQEMATVYVDLNFNQINFRVDASNGDPADLTQYRVDYSLYYSKINNTIAPEITSFGLTNFNHLHCAGSVSTGCTPDQVKRTIIKFRVGFGDEVFGYLAIRYENGTGDFTWVSEDNGNDQLSLTDEEEDWLRGIEPTPTPSPSTGNTTSSGPASPPVCNSTAPGAPALSIVSTGTNSTTLSWTAVVNTTHYMIRYGTASGIYIYGAPNVGNTTNFTVNLLSAGTPYYFQVAAVNNCMPGSWSNEVGTRVFGNVFQPGPAEGFNQQTLGASTEVSPTPTATASPASESTSTDVLTEDDETNEKEESSSWSKWFLPLIALILFLLWLISRRRKKKTSK